MLYMIVITFGTFDLFHIGHLNILKKCREYKTNNNKVIVGVSSDKLNENKKNKIPITKLSDRIEIIKNIKGVQEVFIEESLAKKREYCLKYKADVLIMGNDHVGRFDFVEKDNIEVVYVDRTDNVSTSEIIEKIKEDYKI
jgi:glycerol-3-phosphate cytidylyltransferase